MLEFYLRLSPQQHCGRALRVMFRELRKRIPIEYSNDLHEFEYSENLVFEYIRMLEICEPSSPLEYL